jgi:hypothetical protein
VQRQPVRRQLEQSQRVAARLAQQPVDGLVGDGFVHVPADQLGGRGPVQAVQGDGRQVGVVEERRLARAHGQHDPDRVRQGAPEGEQQRGRARGVEPVRVVHQDEHR